MTPAGFEPAIPASDRLQTQVLDRAVTGIELNLLILSSAGFRSMQFSDVHISHLHYALRQLTVV